MRLADAGFDGRARGEGGGRAGDVRRRGEGRPQQRRAGGAARMGADGLRRAIVELDRRGYPAYKPLRGGYDFGDFTLSIDHVQGDPFAAPSKLSAFVAADVAGFPREWVDDPYLRRALEDCLVRRLSGELARRSFRARGSGKSGLLATSRPGPEVIERTACQVVPEGVIARFEAGFPAAGRSILADELVEMLLDLVPRAVRASLMADALPAGMARRAVELADDQRFVRGELERRGLVCFVADGSVLPRESGVSSRPMRDALPFRSPDSLRVTLDLPHRGQTAGMGVPRGVTLIVGGGYHGKTTLLKAIEAGVYDHVAGDGRELVLTDATACKLRAEDGRLVSDVDVSPFIGELPDGTDTHHFSTLDASGSTSQAASLMEDVQAGARALLVDEDTCAANFMVRDALMQRVVSADHEPITPFVERVRELWERRGVSTVIVAGSSGAFFFVADTVIQMDSYRALDITERVRRACAEAEGDRPRQAPAEGSALSGSDEPGRDRVVEAAGASRGRQRRGGARGRGGQGRPSDGAGADEGRVKVRSSGLDEIEVGQARADLRLVEQLVDPEQLDALAQMVRWAAARGLLSGTPVDRVVDEVMEQVGGDGLASVADSCPACGLAMPRTQEVYACLNRLRG